MVNVTTHRKGQEKKGKFKVSVNVSDDVDYFSRRGAIETAKETRLL